MPTAPAGPTQNRLSDLCLAIFEHALDAIFVIDDERRFVEANAAGCTLLGVPRATILGRTLETFMRPPPEYGVAEVIPRWADFLKAGSRQDECVIHLGGGMKRRAAYRARASFQPGLHIFVAHDVTERRFVEDAVRQAEQLYRTLVETTRTGYAIADGRGCVLDANTEYIHLSGHATLDEVLDRHPLEWTLPADRARLAAGLTRCLDESIPLREFETEFIDASGHHRPVEINATMLSTADGPHLLCLCHDIAHRVLARRELEESRHELERRVDARTAELGRANGRIQSRARQQESVADLGRRALAGADLDELMREAVETVGGVLGMEYSAVVEHADPESDQLLLRAAHGWKVDGVLGRAVATTDPAFLTGYALNSAVPVVFEDRESETRFQMSPGLAESGVVSGMTVQIGGNPQPFGVIAAHSRAARRYTPDDIYFLQSIANVLAAAIERKRSEEIVRLAQQGAISANNAKIEFLSRMSHELRTPLNAILGFSQLLEIERLDTGQRESVEQITRAGRHLLELVNEVLDISRIDSGNMNLTPEPLAVDELAREALDLIRPLADARGITLSLDPELQGSDLHVLADRQRLRQVLLNLLSNAVKYNCVNGRVTLGGGPAPDGKRVRLSVADTGRGIAPEKLPLLFTPFERLGAENTDVEGSGIGLALAKRLVESQGGELSVQSEPGIGSTFSVDLPLAVAPLEEESTPLDAVFGATLFLKGEEEAETGAPLSAARTVLHIEDNQPNRRLLEMLVLQRPAWRLMTATRGHEGLTMARKHQPDLILLDMHLPDTTGEIVLKKLRASEETRNTPVVMVSADAASMRRNQEESTGANSYLTKPFNVGQFLKLLDQYLVTDAA